MSCTPSTAASSDKENHDQEEKFIVASFYKFTKLENFEELREPLLAFCLEKEIKGSILLALEGINASVSGSRKNIDALMDRLRSDPRLENLEYKENLHVTRPFLRTKVRLKREIVNLGVPVDPTSTVGTYVEPEKWNELITDPEVLVIDTRNTYETDLGTFNGALDPKTEKFTQFPSFCEDFLKDKPKDQKIAMFCTGGIRCEKSTSFLKQKGFENVYHLKGGILKYLEEVPAEKSEWSGKCYVFDDRIAVDHTLEPVDELSTCFGCRNVLRPSDKDSPDFKLGVHCSHCINNVTPKHLAKVQARAHQEELKRKQEQLKRKQDAISE